MFSILTGVGQHIPHTQLHKPWHALSVSTETGICVDWGLNPWRGSYWSENPRGWVVSALFYYACFCVWRCVALTTTANSWVYIEMFSISTHTGMVGWTCRLDDVANLHQRGLNGCHCPQTCQAGHSYIRVCQKLSKHCQHARPSSCWSLLVSIGLLKMTSTSSSHQDLSIECRHKGQKLTESCSVTFWVSQSKGDFNTILSRKFLYLTYTFTYSISEERESIHLFNNLIKDIFQYLTLQVNIKATDLLTRN